MVKLNLTGQKFGRLLAIKDAGRNKSQQVIWECLCECGKTALVVSSKLKNGHTKSCGCLQKDVVTANETTHGESNTELYRRWQSLKNRCENPNNKEFHNYGGRGIKVCEKWQTFEGFKEDYYQLSGDGDSIDRIDVNGDYSFENCRKLTSQGQSINTRRSSYLAPFIPVYRILYELSQNKEYIARILNITIGQSYTLYTLAFENDQLNKISTIDLLSMSKKEIEDLL